jgi:hypothetical protein
MILPVGLRYPNRMPSTRVEGMGLRLQRAYNVQADEDIRILDLAETPARSGGSRLLVGGQ